jgi:hypothetical protein
MATVKSYKELVVYQKGYEVAKMIYGSPPDSRGTRYTGFHRS